MKLLSRIALLLAVTPAAAQFGNAGAPPTMPRWSRSAPNPGAIHPHRAHPHNSPQLALGQVWLDTYPSQSGQPTYIVLPPPAAAPIPLEQPKPVTPLMIERQGDRFVRTTSVEPLLSNGSPTASPIVDHHQEKQIPASPPITLIYRDGHREQIQNYSIVADRLYASTDYAQSGAWMKTVHLSALNLPATIEANRNSGAAFTLPSAPNVVVTNF